MMIEMTELNENNVKIALGYLYGIEISVVLDPRETGIIEEVNLWDLDPDILQDIKKFADTFKESNNTLGRFTRDFLKTGYEISRDQYYDLLALQESILSTRSIPNREFLPYLLHLLSVKDLKAICKEYQLTGFSKLKKSELVNFISESLDEQEIRDLLKEREAEVLEGEIREAIFIFKRQSSERLKHVNVANAERNELELTFSLQGKWETESLLGINEENMVNPLRDCDCIAGREEALCRHFWVGFLILAIKKRFEMEEWSLTDLPDFLLEFIEKRI